MRTREHVPRVELEPYVRLIWILEVEDPVAFGPPERICPDGLLEVVFHYRTPLACRYDGQPFARQPRSASVSQTRHFVEIRPEGPIGLISVRFQPWGAYHFFRLPMSELADRQLPTEALWGRAGLDLEERLGEALDDAARIGLLEQFLLAQLRRHHKADVERLVRAVWERHGDVAVSQLCRELGVGERRLQRTFAAALGTSPKRFCTLTRFLHACAMLRRGSQRRLGDVGLALSYYDQSHFIADFRAFSGLTPSQFVEGSSTSFLEIG